LARTASPTFMRPRWEDHTPENAEVAGEAGIPFEAGALAGTMRRVLAMPEAECDRLRRAAVARVRANYSWDVVTDAYEELLKGMCSK
jgi:glycosyltransferase involved in cell wall biosynthesis